MSAFDWLLLPIRTTYCLVWTAAVLVNLRRVCNRRSLADDSFPTNDDPTPYLTEYRVCAPPHTLYQSMHSRVREYTATRLCSNGCVASLPRSRCRTTLALGDPWPTPFSRWSTFRRSVLAQHRQSRPRSNTMRCAQQKSCRIGNAWRALNI